MTATGARTGIHRPASRAAAAASQIRTRPGARFEGADATGDTPKVVGCPPLSEMSDLQRRELHEALLDADTFEDVPGKRQAAILKAEQNRPNLRIVGSE